MNQKKPDIPIPQTWEGDLSPNVRPQPGKRDFRPVWTGNDGEMDPVIIGSSVESTRNAQTEFGSERQLRNGRVIGLDVARGLALIGMIAAHTLVSTNFDTGESTIGWKIWAGNAAALFAVLAGVSIAVISGGIAGRKMGKISRIRLQLAVRALVIFTIGIIANQLIDPPVYNILPYYAILFLFAILFLNTRKRLLIIFAGILTFIGPLIEYVVRSTEPFERELSPTIVDLLTNPIGVVGTLLFTGTYPAATWFVYVLVGMAIGRMALDRLQVQINLITYGFLLMISGWGLSRLSVYYLGGYEAMLYSEVRITQNFLERTMSFGPDSELPTSSLWWLTIAGPHTNTPFSLMLSTGAALSVLGTALVVCRIIPKILYPLSVMGGMTLTLYISHMTVLHYVDIGEGSTLWFAIQVFGALILAMIWKYFFKHGPLEKIVAEISKSVLWLPSKNNARHRL